MQYLRHKGRTVALVEPTESVATAQDALDRMVTARYEGGADALVIRRENLAEAFFDLRTGLAGEILQKFSNYQMRLAIVGDFSGYGSKALRDFIGECNRGRQVCWVPGLQAALDALAS
ncbi:MAG: DUF4180 domain-containing protein [Clostridiales bacterium]|nr:DUF4180 domain-containing protein [Clostridiales bacterium]